MRGCIHIYTGDGKGKTTACVGLAVRCAGSGRSVVFSQFLKDGSSSEIRMLKQLPGITVYSCTEKLGFAFNMNEEEKAYAASCYSNYFREVIQLSLEKQADLLVMDEAVAAYNNGFIDAAQMQDFLKQKPEKLEVVLSGRNPAPELVELADYVSEIRKVKHPFDAGICAREGIEF